MDAGTDIVGSRARAELDGQTYAGTVTDATYTPKTGGVVVRLELDEQTPDGREAVALGVEDLTVE